MKEKRGLKKIGSDHYGTSDSLYSKPPEPESQFRVLIYTLFNEH